jgi:hypothetical protein
VGRLIIIDQHLKLFQKLKTLFVLVGNSHTPMNDGIVMEFTSLTGLQVQKFLLPVTMLVTILLRELYFESMMIVRSKRSKQLNN